MIREAWLPVRRCQTTILTIGGYEATDVLSCLRNGSPAAAHFARDLAAARALAARAAQIATKSPRSRAAADLAIRIREIDLDNSGCASCGGYVVTRLSTVRWRGQSARQAGLALAGRALP